MDSPFSSRRIVEGIRTRKGTLQTRLGLAMGLAILIIACLFFTILSGVLQGYFGTLQDQLTISRLEQVGAIFGQTAKAQTQLTQVYAEWDDTWNFLDKRNPGYLEDTYYPSIMASGLDLVMVFDEQKSMVGSLLITEKKPLIVPPEGLDLTKLAAGPLLDGKIHSGFVHDAHGILILAACPVRRSDLSGKSNGWLVLGSYLDRDKTSEIDTMSGVLLAIPSSLITPDSFVMPIQVMREFPPLGEGQLTFPSASALASHIQDTPARLSFSSMIPGETIALDLTLPIRVYRNAIATKNWILVFSTIGAIAVALIGLLVVHRTVIRPLVELDLQMQKMSDTLSDVPLAELRRDDEIGRLAHSASSLLQSAIHGRKVAEDRKALLSSVLDSASESVMAFRSRRNAEGKVVDLAFALVNHSMELLAKIPASELLGKAVRTAFPKMVEAGIYDRWVSVAETGEPVTFESFYDGHKITGWFSYSVCSWSDGIVVTLSDISERKRREQELADSYAEMDRFNAAMIGREERIIGMKKEVNDLRAKAGLSPLYEVQSDDW